MDPVKQVMNRDCLRSVGCPWWSFTSFIVFLDGGFDGKEPPSWSCDVSRVAPLVVAFEEEVNEKNEIIQVCNCFLLLSNTEKVLNSDLNHQEYEEELRRFKAYFEEMMQRQEKVFSFLLQ